MNTVTLRCPSIGCGQILSVAGAARGKLVSCRYCKRVVRVPAARGTTPAPAATTTPPAR
jgi:hypothetical protein